MINDLMAEDKVRKQMDCASGDIDELMPENMGGAFNMNSYNPHHVMNQLHDCWGMINSDSVPQFYSVEDTASYEDEPMA